MNELLIAAAGGIVVLAIERAIAIYEGIKREHDSVRNAQDFLREWYIEVERVLSQLNSQSAHAKREWQEYREALEADPNANFESPRLPYERIVLPDVSKDSTVASDPSCASKTTARKRRIA